MLGIHHLSNTSIPYIHLNISSDFVVMGDNPTKAAKLHSYDGKAKPITYNQLQLFLDGKVSFEELISNGNQDGSSEVHWSDGTGVNLVGSRLVSDTSTGETFSDVCLGVCVQSASDGIEVSPTKGNRLFD